MAEDLLGGVQFWTVGWQIERMHASSPPHHYDDFPNCLAPPQSDLYASREILRRDYLSRSACQRALEKSYHRDSADSEWKHIATHYQVDLAPASFVPHNHSPINRLLAHMQFLALWWGYHTTWPARNWSMPPSTPAQSAVRTTVVPIHVERLPQQHSLDERF
jgi:hypothetical protein